MTIEIEILTGPPGCGKSTAMRLAAVQDPGLYLFALPTLPLIKEQAEAFRAEAPHLDVTEAHSASGSGGSVERQVERTLARLAEEGIGHAVVLTTHQSLMKLNLKPFIGWHVRIDEAPDAVQSGVVKMAAFPRQLESYFDLEPVGSEGWSAVHLKDEAPSWKALENDLLKPLGEFFKLAARSHGVFINQTSWAKSFQWVSYWPPAMLEPFATRWIAAATYMTSLGAVIAERYLSHEVTFRTRTLVMHRSAQPEVRVHYFTEGHEGTTRFWGTSEGRRCIVGFCDFLAEHEPELGFWAANEVVANLLEHRVHGGPIKPKVAGLNSWREKTSCAFIYSSKPTPSDEPLKQLFDLTDDEIRRAREDEDVVQFAMRGALRNPDFGGGYDVYLYSRRQAQTLAAHLVGSGVGDPVVLLPEPGAGIMDTLIDTPGKIQRADESDRRNRRKADKAASAKASRAKKAVAAGRAPGKSGRPKK